jgi:hypothetical protein
MRKQVFALLLSMLVAFAFIPWYMKPLVKAETTIFSDGFESGTILTTDVPPGAWTSIAVGGASSATVSTDSPHHGSYNVKFIAGSSGWACVKESFTAAATAFVRCYYTFNTLPGVGERIYLTELRVFSNDGVGVALENIDGNLFWLLRIAELGVTTEVYEAVASNPVTGVPYCVEIRRDVTSGLEELWIDGVSRASADQSITRDSSEIVVGYGYSPSVNQQTCYADCVVVADAYIGPEDSVPPTFGSISTNTTIAEQSCSFNCLANDETNVSTYIFSTNDTGVWTNDTAVAFSSFLNETAAWANVTKTLNNTVGNVVSFIWYANDTSNNWSHSGQYNLTTTAIQHYLTVASPYGTPGGQGWYGNGSTAYATLDTGTVDQGNGTRRVFNNWSGDASGTGFAQSDSITMDENKTATAVWKTQYNVTFAYSGLDSSASGKVVTINEISVTYDQLPYSFWADNDSVITYSYDNVSSKTSGKRFILTGVSGPSAPITLTELTIVTGDYGTQYEVTFDQTGVESDFPGTVITIDSIDYSHTDLPTSFWWDKDSNHTFSFDSSLLVNTNKQYDWTATFGLSTLQSGTLTITVSGSIVGNYVTANRITFDQIGVNPDFTGTVLEVDGTPYTANMLPVSFMWEAGSIHSFTFLSPLVVSANAKRYLWTSTTGLSNLQSDTIAVTIYGSIIGNCQTQYFLTVTSSYGTPNGGGWYESGTTAYAGLDTGIVDHGNGTRRVFADWSGDASGSDYLQCNPILMEGPKNAVANWKSQYLLEVLTVPVGLTPQPTRDPVGENGSVGWWYDVSVNVSLTASHVGFDSFERWDIDGVNQSLGVNPITLIIDAPHIATAHYSTPDIAVESVVPSKTVVGQGHSMLVNVTVIDLGFSAEIFNITVYANNIPIENQIVILAPGDSLTVYFTWNSSGLVYGNYTISAYAWPVHSEINIANNNCTSSTEVHVGIPGDVSGPTVGVYDGTTNMRDINYLIQLFNTKPSSPNWKPNADINNDGVVNMRDINIAIMNFNKNE